MSRSLLVSLSSFAFVAFLIVPGSALGQGFTEADLVGDYAYRAQPANNSLSMHLVGRLTMDGLGGVTGSRTISRQIPNGFGTSFVAELVEQELSGTYSVGDDGIGVMSIEATPNPDWLRVPADLALEFDRPEALRFALADGGRRIHINVDVPARMYRPTDGAELGRIDLTMEGEAMAQEPSEGASDARIDALQAQLCEVLRLLNTPQGRRETSTAEVLDACGTGFEWNGEVTGGPRRGR